MASLRVAFYILLCGIICTTGQNVELSSNILETTRKSVACVGQMVEFVCTGEDIVFMRWIIEPFVNSSNPLTFNPQSTIGSCHSFGAEGQTLVFCLKSLVLAPDKSTVSMTSTLMFNVEKTGGQNRVSLSGSVIHCNDQNKTLLVIEDIPLPPVDLKCNASDSFSTSTYGVTCTWSPQSHYIQSYLFSVSSILNGKESQIKLLPVIANKTTLEFFLNCSLDGIMIEAVTIGYCNSSNKTTVVVPSGKCSEPQNHHGGQTVAAVVVVPIALVVIGVLIIGIVTVYVMRRKLKAKLQVKWKKCQDLPVGMSQVHVVKINDKLYCRSGNSRIIYICSIRSGIKLNDWRELNRNCPVEMFALTHFSINGQRNLVAVGGVNSGQSVLAENIHVYPIEGEKNPKWITSTCLGKLNTPRLYPAAITCEEYIIVCGGIPSLDPSAESTDIVEIYDGYTWNIVSPLPMKGNRLSLACAGKHLYVMGGEESEKAKKNVARTSLVSLPQVSEWNEVASCPLAGSTAVGLGEELLAVGGKTTQWWPLSLLRKFEDQRSVYVYDNKNNKWVFIGQTDIKVYMAGTKHLSGNDFVVIGGECEENAPQKSVYVGTYNYSTV